MLGFAVVIAMRNCSMFAVFLYVHPDVYLEQGANKRPSFFAIVQRLSVLVDEQRKSRSGSDASLSLRLFPTG